MFRCKGFISLVCMAVLVVISQVLISNNASADDFHYRNYLIGERASGMGGAYTAVSDTPAGNFYNPAGIIYITGSSLSASVNAYNYSKKTYKNTLTKADGSKVDYEQNSSILLPNYFGFVSNLGNAKVGFSYAVPDAIQRKQKQIFTDLQSSIGTKIDRYSININDIDNSYLFGPSLAFEITEGLAVGATLYGYYRDATIIRNQLVELSNGQFEWTNQYQDRNEWGLQPKLGVMLDLTDKVSLGCTVSHLWITSSDVREQTTYRGISSAGYSDPDLVSFNVTNSDQNPKTPWVGTVGIAWFPNPEFILATDLTYYTEVSGKDQKESTFNMSAGVEYYLSKHLALRGGLFTDLANTPEVRVGGINQREHVDLYGASFSLTRFTRASSTTLGVVYATGSGDGQIVANSTKIQDLAINNLSVYLSASYSF